DVFAVGLADGGALFAGLTQERGAPLFQVERVGSDGMVRLRWAAELPAATQAMPRGVWFRGDAQGALLPVSTQGTQWLLHRRDGKGGPEAWSPTPGQRAPVCPLAAAATRVQLGATGVRILLGDRELPVKVDLVVELDGPRACLRGAVLRRERQGPDDA